MSAERRDDNVDDRSALSLTKRHNPKFIFVQWLDYLGQMRTRCLPVSEFEKLPKAKGSIAISTGNLGTLQNDHMTSVCDPVGAIYVQPDPTFQSLRPMQNLGPIKNAATIMSRFTDADGVPLSNICPRAKLEHLVQLFKEEFGVDFLVGFEIEIAFCKRSDGFEPLDTTHAWGTFTDEQYVKSMELMLTITTALKDLGVEIMTMHSEVGAGQYEFVLPPYPPLLAVDTLIQARQCIMQIAAFHGLRATCHPTPFPGIGAAAHAHISFNNEGQPGSVHQGIDTNFMAGVLEHLPALCAFTMPQAASYGRVIDDSWTGGTWIAWGDQNREVPLRRSGYMRWEVRCLDGFANMYLGLAVILAAGLHAVKSGTVMAMKNCSKNPTKLSAQERQDLGIKRKLPTSLPEAIKAARNDKALEKAMGSEMYNHYLAMKEEEQEMLGEMSEKDRRVWLMERY